MRANRQHITAGNAQAFDRRTAMTSMDLPPARCERHADRGHPAPCSACMRAQQLRQAAHEAASIAAARDWQVRHAAGDVGLSAAA